MNEDANQDIEKRLLSSLKQTLTALYPKGKVEGGEFVIGDIEGAEGKSLKVRLRDGVWSDFSTGQSGKIFKLFAARHNGNFHAGMNEIRSIFKLPPPIPQNKFKRPKVDWDELNDDNDAYEYLNKERAIPKGILKQCKVRCTRDEYVFLGYDELGKVAYAQYTAVKRSEDGKKRIRFAPSGNSAKLVLWGMGTMQHLATDGALIITEGVIDAMSFRACDLFAVSIPSGVANHDWITHCWDWLAQFEKIYLCLDYDSAGQEQIQKIAGRLGVHRCYRVILPKKDANEVLLSGEIQLLKKAIDEAVDIAPAKRVTPSSLKDSVVAFIKQGPLMAQGDLLLGWHFPDTEYRLGLNFRFRRSEQTIWTGYAGGGKTSLLFQHAAYSMFILGQKIAIASLEEPAEKVITVLARQAIGFHPDPDADYFKKVYDVIQSNLVLYNVLGRADIDEVLEFFEYSSKKDGVSHCILDSLMRTNLDVDGDRTKVNELILKIIESTNRVGAHYHIVAHSVKGNDEDYKEMPGMNSVKGIQEIVANAHNVIAVWRNKAKENSIEGSHAKGQSHEAVRKKDDKGDTIIKITKNRNGKQLGQIPAWFSVHNDRFRPEPDERTDRPYFDCED